MLQVSDDQRNLTCEDGRPFFYLADTSWASFGNVPIELWRPYLRQRKAQGFNALQISILPIVNDRSVGPGLIEPFPRKPDGGYEYSSPNIVYFDKAEAMIEMAIEYEFIPVLGMIWCCYAVERNTPNPYLMKTDEVRVFSTFAATRFSRFNPIYFISGDTPLYNDEEIERYRVAFEVTKKISPDALYTMHICGNRVIDERLAEGIDFYMYQSGHGATSQSASRKLAAAFRELPRKPIVNGEPCYEGHGRMGDVDANKFSAFDVRRATWQSLLSGASMGITYGAQGIWSGQVDGLQLQQEKRKFEAYQWEYGYNLDGAWDVGYAKWLFENYGLFDLEPSDIARNAVRPDDPEIVAAATTDLSKIVLYAPYTTSVEIDADLRNHTCSCIDLQTRRVWFPTIRYGERSVLEFPQFNHDMLCVAIKN
jgi:hypothetical protein